MKKANIGFYLQTVNDVVTDSEKVGEKMNPSYELIRQAIDTDKLNDLTVDELRDTVALFTEGTNEYREMDKSLKSLKAPVRVIGIHKKLEKAFTDYVAGCQEMIDSINAESGTVDVDKFNTSEIRQDEATDTISFCIQRMTTIVMNR